MSGMSSTHRLKQNYVRESSSVARLRWFAFAAVTLVFSTSFAPFVGEGQRNWLVIVLCALSPIVLVITGFKLKRDSAWALGAVSYYATINIIGGIQEYASSLAYTLGLMAAYLLFCVGLTGRMTTRSRMRAIIRWVILAYASVALIQAAALLLKLPIPNAILMEGLGRQNSLAVEPSHLGRAIAMLLLCYLRLEYGRQALKRRSFALMISREWPVLSAAIVSVALSGSSLAFLALPTAVLLAFKISQLAVLALLLAAATPFLKILELPAALERALGFLEVLPSLDMAELVRADHSASVRLMAPLIYMDQFDLSDLQTWVGGGLGSISAAVDGKMIGVPDEVSVVGFFPGYFLTAGILGSILFIYSFLFRFIVKATFPLIILWIFLFITSPLNSQLFWLGLMLVRALHHFSNISSDVADQRSVRDLRTGSRLLRQNFQLNRSGA